MALAQHNLERAYEAGIPIAIGTDSGAFTGRFPGYFEHMDLELMVEAGMSEMDTTHAATGMAAQCTDVQEDLGTLGAGKWADFIVLAENPLEDMNHTRSIESVWIAGAETAD